ncbi:MAG: PqqD family protein [Lysobacterales bacterium]
MNPKKAANLVQEDADGHLIVLDGDNGQVHKLNPTAAMILELCDGALSAEEIAAEVASACDVDVSLITDDVRATLAEFAEKDLISLA